MLFVISQHMAQILLQLSKKHWQVLWEIPNWSAKSDDEMHVLVV
jgi:hypothetical protein